MTGSALKIAVMRDSVPFGITATDRLADTLIDELNVRGHHAELVKTLLRTDSALHVAESMFAAASVRIPEADKVIALSFPSYLLPHPNKTVWLHEPFDYLTRVRATTSAHAEFERLGLAIRRAELQAMMSSRSIFATGDAAADHIARSSGFDAIILTPPADSGLSTEASVPVPSSATPVWDEIVEMLLT